MFGCTPGALKALKPEVSSMALQDKLIDSLGSFATKFNSYRYI
ncbi:MAG: hypothetical protein E7K17_15755, partial [Klebsiella michiganensis]|nr:hypothetical protein [Klebsiella michiganensis]